jgi:hypothetical protein
MAVIISSLNKNTPENAYLLSFTNLLPSHKAPYALVHKPPWDQSELQARDLRHPQANIALLIGVAGQGLQFGAISFSGQERLKQ